MSQQWACDLTGLGEPACVAAMRLPGVSTQRIPHIPGTSPCLTVAEGCVTANSPEAWLSVIDQAVVLQGLAQLTRGTNVTVNSVLAGPTWTGGVQGYMRGLAEQAGKLSHMKHHISTERGQAVCNQVDLRCFTWTRMRKDPCWHHDRLAGAPHV